jgi:hypothetical protein
MAIRHGRYWIEIPAAATKLAEIFAKSSSLLVDTLA